MVRNNVTLQVNWIKSTNANIPKNFLMPPVTPNTSNTTVPKGMTTPLLTYNRHSNIPESSAQNKNTMNTMLRLNGVPSGPSLNRSLSGLENVEPTRRTSGLSLMAKRERIPAPQAKENESKKIHVMNNDLANIPAVPKVSPELPKSMDILQLLKDKGKAKIPVPTTTSNPTVVDLTDEKEENGEEDELFFDSSDFFTISNVGTKRHSELNLQLPSTSKRHKSVSVKESTYSKTEILEDEENDFDDDLEPEIERRLPLRKTESPKSMSDELFGTLNSDRLKALVSLQAHYITLCEEKMRLLQDRMEITESTALSEDMKRIEKEKLTPKLVEAQHEASVLKQKLRQFDSILNTNYDHFEAPTSSRMETRNIVQQEIVHTKAQNEKLQVNIETIVSVDHEDDKYFGVPSKIVSEVENSDSDEDNVRIIQVTQNTSERNLSEARKTILGLRANQSQNVMAEFNHQVADLEEEEEDNFGGDYTNQGLQTDDEEVVKLDTQEQRELNEFIEPDDADIFHDFEEDISYKDEDEDEDVVHHSAPSEDDAIDDIIKEAEDLKESSDLDNDNIHDSLQDRIDNNMQSNIELISSDIEDDYGDGFVSQLNLEREVDLKMEDESDAFDDDDDEMIELTTKKSHTINNSNFISSSPPPPIDTDDEIQEIDFLQNEGAVQKYPWSNEAYQILRDVFNLSDFRSNQLEAVNSILSGSDVFVLMPTGGGKSLCYQLPALVQSGKTRGTTIVISPLISLMQDQVDHLLQRRIKAGMINSKATADERKHMFNLFREGLLDLVYLSPEMIGASGRVRSVIEHLNKNGLLARIVVDEAHCVSSWGHDFRPDYKSLSYFKETYPEIPMMALTATANEHVRMDILHNLGIKGAKLFKQSFNRTNLFYKVLIKDKLVLEKIKDLLSTKYRGQSGIIYCHSKISCEQTSEKLLSARIKAAYYHAGMTPEDRLKIQKDWQVGKIQVICATIAFGMGIDKPDVRIVIHLTIPRTLEGYYQETGRAGRDGKHSDCIMFFSYKDARSLQGMIQKDKELDRDGKEKHMNKLRQVLQYCDNKTDCRRQQVLQYFNEKFDKKDCHKQCDNCCNGITMIEKDVTEYARDMISLVKSIQDCTVTLIYCQDVFKGSKSGKIIAAQHDMSPYHGKGKDLDKGTIERIFFHLISEQILEEYSVMNNAGFASNYIKAGRYANTVLEKGKRIVIGFNVDSNKAPPPNASRTPSVSRSRVTSLGNNLELFRYDEDKPIAHFTQASSELRRQQSFNNNPIVLSKGDFTNEQEQFINKCYSTLLDIRTRKMTEFNYTSTAQFMPDLLLREMAIALPTNAKDYKKLTGHTPLTLDKFPFFKQTLMKLGKEKLKGNFSNLEIPPSSMLTTQGNSSNGDVENNNSGHASKYFSKANDPVYMQLVSIHESQGSQRSTTQKQSQRNKYGRGGGGGGGNGYKSKRGSQRNGGNKRNYSNGRKAAPPKTWAKPMQP